VEGTVAVEAPVDVSETAVRVCYGAEGTPGSLESLGDLVHHWELFFKVAGALWRHREHAVRVLVADDDREYTAIGADLLEERLSTLSYPRTTPRIERFCQSSPLEFVVIITASVGMIKALVMLAEQAFDLTVKVRDEPLSRMLKEARVARELEELGVDPVLANSMKPDFDRGEPESVELERRDPA
jgi:hypothetical protein